MSKAFYVWRLNPIAETFCSNPFEFFYLLHEQELCAGFSELPIPKLWDLNPDPDLCSQIGSKSRSLPQGLDLNPDPIFSDPNPDPTD